MKYRPDIDGLRAISVLLVIMFHANVGIFTGGFIGVDVFFVISGYLITRIIYDAATASSFSFIEFYNRRIRRILPALFVVLFASAILGYYLLAPREYLSFGKSLIYSSIALSNFLFMSQVGYFDAPAHTKPLLHTWSLGIEEQFYLFFPLIIYLAVKYIPRKINMLIVTLFIISLAANILLVVSHQSVAFYSPITRAWEFLMGSMLAVNLRNFKIKRATLKECASLIGIASIIIPAIIYDKNTLFPGWNAILPCLGAALLIFSNADGKTAVGKVLSIRSVVFIGLISYSLYLWHWPILIYSKYIFMHDPNITELSITLLIIFVLSCLTWKFVERPFRKKCFVYKKKAPVCGLLFLIGFLASFGSVHNKYGWIRLQILQHDIQQRKCHCLQQPEKILL